MATDLERAYASEIEGAIRALYAISDRMYDDGLTTDAGLLDDGIDRLVEKFEVLKETWRIERGELEGF